MKAEIPNRGYRLVELPDILSRNELESGMHTAWAGSTIICLDSIDSTNEQAKRMAEEGAPHGLIVVAEEQTAGRGRRGRNWASPAGKNLYFSLLLRPDFAPSQASMLTLVMALAVRDAMEECYQAGAGIKWPNDIVLNGKKVTGILTEMRLQGETIGHVVIGVGINVKKQTFAEELTHASSLEEELSCEVSRELLFARIMEHFERDYERFCETLDLSGLTEAYNACLVNCKRQVRVLDPAGEFTGLAKGINEKGELLVQTPDGKVHAIYAGEVSVRGIYGYV